MPELDPFGEIIEHEQPEQPKPTPFTAMTNCIPEKLPPETTCSVCHTRKPNEYFLIVKEVGVADKEHMDPYKVGKSYAVCMVCAMRRFQVLA